MLAQRVQLKDQAVLLQMDQRADPEVVAALAEAVVVAAYVESKADLVGIVGAALVGGMDEQTVAAKAEVGMLKLLAAVVVDTAAAAEEVMVQARGTWSLAALNSRS